MAQAVYHVVPSGDQWAVKKQGAEQASRLADSQDDAVRIATSFAQRQTPSRVVVHRADGTIETQHTFETLEEPAPRSGSRKPIVMAAATGAVVALAVTGFLLVKRRDDFELPQWPKLPDRPELPKLSDLPKPDFSKLPDVPKLSDILRRWW